MAVSHYLIQTKQRPLKPEDIARMYDAIETSLGELSELASSLPAVEVSCPLCKPAENAPGSALGSSRAAFRTPKTPA